MKVKLGDLVDFSNGYAFKSSDYVDCSNTVNCRMSNIRPDGSFDIEYNIKFLPDDFRTKYKDYILSDGDIIIAMTDMAGDPKILGVPTIVKSRGYTVLMNQRVGKLTLKSDSIIPEYLKYSLISKPARDYFKSFAGGGVQLNIGKKEILNIQLNLHSLNEQKEIVRKLGLIKKIIGLYSQQIAKLDELVKARFVEMFGDPIDNPMGLPVKTLKELSLLITNGNTPKGGSENYVDEGILFLRSQNVWRNRIELDDVAYIDEATHRSLKKSSLKHKDILITKTGRINTENSSLGRAALYLGADDSANINGHVYLVRLDGSVVPEYVVTILTSEAYRKYIRKVCVGGIDKRQINLDQVEDFPIIIPPIEQQEQFSAFLEQVDKSKFAVQKTLDEAQTLFNSLMQHYFG